MNKRADSSLETPRWTVLRVLALLAAILFTLLALVMAIGIALALLVNAVATFITGTQLIAYTLVAVITWWYVLSGHKRESRRRMELGCLGGLIGLAFGMLSILVAPLFASAPDFQDRQSLPSIIYFSGTVMAPWLGFIAGTFLGMVIGFRKPGETDKA